MASERDQATAAQPATDALGEFLMRDGDAARVLDETAARDRALSVARKAAQSAELSEALAQCKADSPRSRRGRRPAGPSERIEYQPATSVREPARRDTLEAEPRVQLAAAVDPRRQDTEPSAPRPPPVAPASVESESDAALVAMARRRRHARLGAIAAFGALSGLLMISVLVWAVGPDRSVARDVLRAAVAQHAALAPARAVLLVASAAPGESDAEPAAPSAPDRNRETEPAPPRRRSSRALDRAVDRDPAPSAERTPETSSPAVAAATSDLIYRRTQP